jgi:hypothetical protein
MPNSISSFTDAFKGGFRKNRFLVEGNFPDEMITTTTPPTPPPTGSNEKIKFHVLAAEMPGAQLGVVNFPYRGRLIPYVGDREYAPWIFQVLDDSNSGLYKKFHDWSNRINDHLRNEHSSTPTSEDSFEEQLLVGTWSISQLDLNGEVHKKIVVEQCWPSYVSEIQFNMADTGFNAFAVKLRYNYIRILNINY